MGKTVTVSPVEICENHTGKMEGIQSISTSVVLNEFCQRNQKVEGAICAKCYAENMAEMYSALAAKLARNTKVLTERVLDEDELPDTTGQEIFRFESFGDLNNETQLINYLNIVKKNPETRFTLWTKRYALVCKYFDGKVPPENFTLILSSMFVNKPLALEPLRANGLGGFAEGQLKTFTVYNAAYIKDHLDTIDINCGSRLCAGCRLCYDKNCVEEIREILKSDQTSRLEFAMNFADENKRRDILDSIEDAMNSIGEIDL